MNIVSVVGNPRPNSRTHRLAETLATAVASATGIGETETVDLAQLGPAVLDFAHPEAAKATEQVLTADILVVASPTYKATYSGLLKAFLDRIGGGALNGTPAVPVLLGGAPNHLLAVDVHFTPLLREIGARVPAGGLFVLESQLDEFPATATAWAERNARFLAPAGVSGTCRRSLPSGATGSRPPSPRSPGQTELARHGAHTFWGTRTAATIAAHTLLRTCLAAA